MTAPAQARRLLIAFERAHARGVTRRLVHPAGADEAAAAAEQFRAWLTARRGALPWRAWPQAWDAWVGGDPQRHTDGGRCVVCRGTTRDHRVGTACTACHGGRVRPVSFRLLYARDRLRGLAATPALTGDDPDDGPATADGAAPGDGPGTADGDPGAATASNRWRDPRGVAHADDAQDRNAPPR